MKGKRTYVRVYRDPVKRDDAILRDALHQAGKQFRYDLFDRNCESFAYWCARCSSRFEDLAGARSYQGIVAGFAVAHPGFAACLAAASLAAAGGNPKQATTTEADDERDLRAPLGAALSHVAQRIVESARAADANTVGNIAPILEHVDDEARRVFFEEAVRQEFLRANVDGASRCPALGVAEEVYSQLGLEKDFTDGLLSKLSGDEIMFKSLQWNRRVDWWFPLHFDKCEDVHAEFRTLRLGEICLEFDQLTPGWYGVHVARTTSWLDGYSTAWMRVLYPFSQDEDLNLHSTPEINTARYGPFEIIQDVHIGGILELHINCYHTFSPLVSQVTTGVQIRVAHYALGTDDF